MAQEYEIINETVVFKKMPLYIEFYEEANISPKIDVSKLVDMVLNFIDHVCQFFSILKLFPRF